MKLSDKEIDLLDFVFYKLSDSYFKTDYERETYKIYQLPYKVLREDIFSGLPICLGEVDEKSVLVDIDENFEFYVEYQDEKIDLKSGIFYTYYIDNRQKLSNEVRQQFELLLGNDSSYGLMRMSTKELYAKSNCKLYDIPYNKFLRHFSTLQRFTDTVLTTNDLSLMYIKPNEYITYKITQQDINRVPMFKQNEDKSMILLVYKKPYEIFGDVLLLYEGKVLLNESSVNVDVARSFSREIVLSTGLVQIKP